LCRIRVQKKGRDNTIGDPLFWGVRENGWVRLTKGY
jgi:hypothetical protein